MEILPHCHHDDCCGLHVLTGIIEDLYGEVAALRTEVKELREEK